MTARMFFLGLALLALLPGAAKAADGQILQFAGRTMGTTYSVKVFEPATRAGSIPIEELRLDVDGVLRGVNDQMSTYLKSSEISRFNESESTEWIEVSPEFARVVDTAQRISAKTNGAFDVTVGPLVDAWNFGPAPRTGKVPSDETLRTLRDSVGYQKLSVRLDSPALRKSVADLRIDLSAIAKGHGVDRVVELLLAKGIPDVFVEIGGEVRTHGSKGGQWWKVGIQVPDGRSDEWSIAHALSTPAAEDHSMATSGDYRNYFEADGVRYSHTLDPRTGKPIEHALASVTIVTANCAEADAWATAINVLGPEQGLSMASQEGLDALLISRSEGGFVRSATGALARYVNDTQDGAAPGANPESAQVQDEAAGNGPWVTMVITAVAFAVILVAMAVGVIFGRRAISGSCGGLANKTNQDGSVSCGLCSSPVDGCKELRERMQQADKAKSR